MAKLTGTAKKAFLERMKKGRRKAARGTAKKKAARKPAKMKAAKKSVRKKTANPRGKLRGAAKAAFVKRMAKARKAQVRGGKKNPKRSKRAPGDVTSREFLVRVERMPGGKRADYDYVVEADSAAEARRIARERGYGGIGRATRRHANARRRNQEAEASAAMYETFHGKAPRRIVHYEELVKFPHHFAECGRLVELRINLDRANPRYPFSSFGDCKVVTTPDGENLYFVGGDQRINLDNLEIGGDKDMVELGPCVYICYHTTKDFHDFAPIDYEHHFGEENGVRPVLAYDRLNKKLFLIGGDYRVKREGIAN